MPVEDGAERVCEVIDGAHAGQLADGDQRGEPGPGRVAGEEGVLPGQPDGADLVLGRVGVELEGAVVEEKDQAGPVAQRATVEMEPLPLGVTPRPSP